MACVYNFNGKKYETKDDLEVGINRTIQENIEEKAKTATPVDITDFSIGENEMLESVSKTIQDLKIRQKKIENNITLTKDPIKKALLEDRYNQIDISIDELIEKNNTETILKVGVTDLNKIKNIFKHSNPTVSDYENALRSLDFWENIKELTSVSFVKTEKEMADFIIEVNDFKRQLLEESKTMIQSLGRIRGYAIQTRDMEQLKADGVRKTQTLSLGDSANSFLQYVYGTLATEARNKDEIVLLKLQEYERLSAKVSKEDKELLKQKRKDGSKTGGLVNIFSQDWFDALRMAASLKRTILSNKNATKAQKAKAFKDWKDWTIKNQVIINPAVLYQKNPDGTFKASEEERQKEIDYVIKYLGETEAKYQIERGESLYNSYLVAYDAFKSKLEAEVALDIITPEEKVQFLTEWVADNSPIIYYNNWFSSDSNVDNAKGSYKYLNLAPKKFTDTGAKTEWYDTNYEKIQANPDIKALYDFIKTQTTEFLDITPKHITGKLQSNFLFQVKKSFAERLLKQGMSGVSKFLKDEFLTTISEYEQDLYSTDRDVIGRPESSIPIQFIKDLGEDATDDLDAIIYAGVHMLEHYRFMSNIEAEVTLANRIVQGLEEILVDGNKKIVNPTNPIILKNGVANVKEQVQYTIDAIMYQKKKKDKTENIKNISDTPESKKLRKDTSRDLYNLNVLLENKQITQKEYEAKKQELEEILKTTKGRQVSVRSIGDFMIKITQLKAMGYNPFTAFNNLGFGIVGNIIHASGGEDFTSREMQKAFFMMLETTKKMASMNTWTTGSAKKIANIMDRLGVMGEVVESQYGTGDIKRKTTFKALSPYVWLRNGDFFIKGMTTVSMLLNKKLANGSSLWEAFREDGTIDESYLNDNEKELWLGNLAEADQAQAYKQFKNKVISVNKIVHGNFDPNSPVLFKSHLLGRLVSQFRLSWISTGIESRFGEAYYSNELQREVKGRYRTFLDVARARGYTETFGMMLTNLIRKSLGMSLSLEGLTSIDKANFKKNLTELQFAIGMTALILMLKHIEDDDEEKDPLVITMINQMSRVQDDISFYVNPNTFVDITRNIIPAVSVVGDGIKALQGAIKYINDEDYDGELAFKRFTKATPILGLYNKFDYQMTRIRSDF